MSRPIFINETNPRVLKCHSLLVGVCIIFPGHVVDLEVEVGHDLLTLACNLRISMAARELEGAVDAIVLGLTRRGVCNHPHQFLHDDEHASLRLRVMRLELDPVSVTEGDKEISESFFKVVWRMQTPEEKERALLDSFHQIGITEEGS
ncbi:uncharacterized protein G2W53_037181 [Senna tora]|uniref:Uncharacterized protein n=1 Tax=Senna tora TaxID=362788 RepID=A0A834W6S9_9FABA|nr:uncharacterized protein G2W53_037181 [Senna tora]